MEIKIGKFNPLESDIFKYIVTPAIGFGIGGAVWGYMFASTAFFGDPGNPLAYLLNGAILGIVGGVSLSIFSADKKFILKGLLFGMLIGLSGFLVGYIVGDILIFPFAVIAGIFSRLVAPLGNGLSYLILAQVPNFLIAGCILGFLFAFMLKKRLLPMALTGALGFPLGYMIGIPTGGLLDNYLLESLFSFYLPRFIVTGIILGLFLGMSVYRSENHRKKES